MAVQVADYPNMPLYKHDLFLGIQGAPMHGAIRRVHSLEILAGTISLVSGIPAIYVMHLIFPAGAAILTVFAYGHLFQLIEPKRIVWCVIGALVFLCANGHMHASYGNMSFVRLYQGKAILATAMIPAIISYSLRFMLWPSPLRWLLLSAAQIASIGMTPTGLWVASSTAAIGIITGVMRLDRQFLVRAAVGFSSSFYAVIAGLYLKQTAKIAPGLLESTREGLFQRFIAYPFGLISFSLLILLVVISAWFFCTTRLARRVSIVFPLALLLFFINPLLIQHVAGNVTSALAHWRCIWVVPLPAMAGILWTLPLLCRTDEKKPRRDHLVYWIILMGFLLTQRHIFSQANRTRMSWPGLKVDSNYAIAGTLNKLAGKGTAVIVPTPVSNWITTFHNHAYPVMDTSDVYWRTYALHIGEKEASMRQALTLYI